MSQRSEKILKVKYLIIMSVLILILLIGIMCLIFLSDENVAKAHIVKLNSLEKDYSDYVMPLNRNDLINAYNGMLSRETIYTLLYEFSLDVLPEFRKNGTENINEFFEKNKEYIYIKTGIDDVETYGAFVEKIKNLPEELVLSKTEIKENSVKKQGQYVTAILVIYYNDDVQSVEINIKLGSYANDDRTSIIFN